MPTYTVTNSNFNLTSKQQKKLAEGITKVHNVVTGANTYFAQVIFNKTKKNNHFMGGKKVTEPGLFLCALFLCIHVKCFVLFFIFHTHNITIGPAQ